MRWTVTASQCQPQPRALCGIVIMTSESSDTFENLISSLENGGEVIYEMPAKNRRAMKKCMDRINKLELALSKQSWYQRSYALLYGTYCGLLQILATTGNPELDKAITAYQVAWRRIKTIKGEDLQNERIRVTFVGRT